MLSKLSSQNFSLILKFYKLYLFDPTIVFQFNFGTKNYFSYFLVGMIIYGSVRFL